MFRGVNEVLEKTVLGNIDLPDQDNSILLRIMKTALNTDPSGRFISVDEIVAKLSKIIIFKPSKVHSTIKRDNVVLKINPNVKKRTARRAKGTLSPVLIITFLALIIFILWILLSPIVSSEGQVIPDKKLDKTQSRMNSDMGKSLKRPGKLG